MIVIEQPNEIAMWRLCALKAALKLEVLGMKRRGRSVYMIVKEEFGFKGSKAKVLEQLEEVMNQRKASARIQPTFSVGDDGEPMI